LKKIILVFSMALIANMVFAICAFAATTDLNIVPIPQTKELGTWEWDVRTFVDKDIEKGRFMTNALYGVVWNKLEVGFDWNINRPVGPFKLSAKYQILDEVRDGDIIGLAVGVENVEGTPNRGEDDPQYYVVISKKIVPHISGYLGYASIDSKDQDFMGGLDWSNDKWQFRVDYLGYDNDNENFISGGVEYQWVKHIDLAGWVTKDSFDNHTRVVIELGFDTSFADITKDGGPV